MLSLKIRPEKDHHSLIPLTIEIARCNVQGNNCFFSGKGLISGKKTSQQPLPKRKIKLSAFDTKKLLLLLNIFFVNCDFFDYASLVTKKISFSMKSESEDMKWLNINDKNSCNQDKNT